MFWSAQRITALAGIALAAFFVAGIAAHRALADPPTFVAKPRQLLVEATSRAGAFVTFPLPAATDDNGDPLVFCDSNPGDFFPIGSTTVTCTAQDQLTTEQTIVSFTVRVLSPAAEQVSRGRVRARISYKKETDHSGFPLYADFRIAILRQGVLVVDAAVHPYPGTVLAPWPGAFGARKSIAVRDLNGDGEPEVLLDLFWGGAHCCFWSDVYSYRPSTRTYSIRTHFWGDLGYQLVDLNGDRKPEFLSGDDRFAYAFSDFADSYFPVQIWSFRAGTFADVTRAFPSAIRTDRSRQWRWYLQARGQRPVRGVLAAWAADECLLGRCGSAFATLEQLRRTGGLTSRYEDATVSPARYLLQLKSFLRRSGYG